MLDLLLFRGTWKREPIGDAGGDAGGDGGGGDGGGCDGGWGGHRDS